MKATLKFKLPKDSTEMDMAITGHKAYMFISDFDNYLRSEYKYHDNEAAYDMRNKFREMLNDNGIDIEGGIVVKAKRKWYSYFTFRRKSIIETPDNIQ